MALLDLTLSWVTHHYKSSNVGQPPGNQPLSRPVVISTPTSRREEEERQRLSKSKSKKARVELSGKESGFVYFDLEEKAAKKEERPPKHSEARRKEEQERSRVQRERDGSEKALMSPVFKTKKSAVSSSDPKKREKAASSSTSQLASPKPSTSASSSSSSLYANPQPGTSRSSASAPPPSSSSLEVVSHITAAVKVPLRRYLAKGVISRDQYKDILHRAVKKIMSKGGEVDADKIKQLVREGGTCRFAEGEEQKRDN